MAKINSTPYLNRESVGAGTAPTLQQILLDRDMRVAFQQKLCSDFPDQTLIVLKVNMPGPVKNNDFVQNLLLIGKRSMLQKFEKQGLKVSYIDTKSNVASLACFCVVDTQDATQIKRLTIDLEDNEYGGRFMDYDVFINGKTVDRETIGYKARVCYLCAENAKVCSRSRTHSVEALHDYMFEQMNERRK